MLTGEEAQLGQRNILPNTGEHQMPTRQLCKSAQGGEVGHTECCVRNVQCDQTRTPWSRHDALIRRKVGAIGLAQVHHQAAETCRAHDLVLHRVGDGVVAENQRAEAREGREATQLDTRP